MNDTRRIVDVDELLKYMKDTRTYDIVWALQYAPIIQTCEDCISREAVLWHICEDKECYKEECKGRTLKRCPDLQWVFDLPSVTPQQPAWIPVSERLPEDNIHVLCQFYLGGMGECYLAHGAFHVVGGLVMTCNEVIAWMPLPEPYEAESEE